MAKPTKAQMKAAIDAFKKEFTPGFYHGSPSNKIKAFDPAHPASEFGSSGNFLTGEKDANATFLTRDPSFASSFLPSGMQLHAYKPGATIYPVSANLGKHFDYETPEGHQVIKEYLAKAHPVPADQAELAQWMRDRAATQGQLKEGAWSAIEDPAFQQHLLDTAHDSFALQEAGRKNVGIFDPKNIRGKFAKYNPEDAESADFMKAEGGSINLEPTRSALPNVNFSANTLRPMPGAEYTGMPATPGVMARLELEKELEKARLRAGISGLAMALPGQHGVKSMPGQLDIGLNTPVGAGNVDISAYRSVNPMPGKGHMQGINAKYTLPFAGGGKVGALTEIMQLIKQQGGTAAAKRLERAADLVPNLENKFQPQALKSAFTADNASAVMVMPPGNFEKYAMPISKEASEYKGYRLGDVYAGNHEQLPKGELDDYLKYLESVKQSGGFRDVPFLNLGQREGHSFPNIQGHEGRHRMRALEKANEDNALVRMIPTPNLREPFPRGSQEEYLDALQNKIGIKPMVTPEQTEDGVRRGLIDLPQLFAIGGNVAKKALQHARPVPFVHFSKNADLQFLDPAKYGTGIKGAEAARLKSAEDIRPRSFFYPDSPNVRPESGLGPHKYSGTSEASYPLHEDPADYRLIARGKAKDPYLASVGVDQVNQDQYLNELERQIKNAGYTGYHTDDAGILFHPTGVQKTTE